MVRKVNKRNQNIGNSQIGDIFMSLKSLREPIDLDLGENEIDDIGVEIIAKFVGKVKANVDLDLSYNLISEKGFEKLSNAANKASVKVKINLTGNEIGSIKYIIDNAEKFCELSIKDSIEMYDCFKIFEINNVKICVNNTNIKVVSLGNLKQCKKEDFCVSPSSYVIKSFTKPQCIDGYSKTCLTSFASKGFVPFCKNPDTTHKENIRNDNTWSKSVSNIASYTTEKANDIFYYMTSTAKNILNENNIDLLQVNWVIPAAVGLTVLGLVKCYCYGEHAIEGETGI